MQLHKPKAIKLNLMNKRKRPQQLQTLITYHITHINSLIAGFLALHCSELVCRYPVLTCVWYSKAVPDDNPEKKIRYILMCH